MKITIRMLKWPIKSGKIQIKSHEKSNNIRYIRPSSSSSH